MRWIDTHVLEGLAQGKHAKAQHGWVQKSIDEARQVIGHLWLARRVRSQHHPRAQGRKLARYEAAELHKQQTPDADVAYSFEGRQECRGIAKQGRTPECSTEEVQGPLRPKIPQIKSTDAGAWGI